MHDTVLGSLDGYIIVFLLSLKCVLWSMRELVARARAEYKRELAGGLSSRLPLALIELRCR